MRKNKKQEDDRQMKLDFQAITTFQDIKPIEIKRLNASLPTKLSKSKVKREPIASKSYRACSLTI